MAGKVVPADVSCSFFACSTMVMILAAVMLNVCVDMDIWLEVIASFMNVRAER